MVLKTYLFSWVNWKCDAFSWYRSICQVDLLLSFLTVPLEAINNAREYFTNFLFSIIIWYWWKRQMIMLTKLMRNAYSWNLPGILINFESLFFRPISLFGYLRVRRFKWRLNKVTYGGLFLGATVFYHPSVGNGFFVTHFSKKCVKYLLYLFQFSNS